MNKIQKIMLSIIALSAAGGAVYLIINKSKAAQSKANDATYQISEDIVSKPAVTADSLTLVNKRYL